MPHREVMIAKPERADTHTWILASLTQLDALLGLALCPKKLTSSGGNAGQRHVNLRLGIPLSPPPLISPESRFSAAALT